MPLCNMVIKLISKIPESTPQRHNGPVAQSTKTIAEDGLAQTIEFLRIAVFAGTGFYAA